MQYEMTVDNIKCGGCAKTIQTQLNRLEGVSETQVDIEHGKVTCELASESWVDAVKQRLLKQGYPESGSIEGLGAMGAKAKSFVSCAVGKMQKED